MFYYLTYEGVVSLEDIADPQQRKVPTLNLILLILAVYAPLRWVRRCWRTSLTRSSERFYLNRDLTRRRSCLTVLA